MKKLVFILSLCIISGSSFAQKKAVKDAKGETKSKNFAVARSLIQEALANPETAEQAETWYVAGVIENDQFDNERLKEGSEETPDKDKMYPALDRILPYFIKADSLDMLPDAKGRVKSKFRKDIKAIMTANRPYYVNAANYFFDRDNFRKAYENFKLYGDIPKLAMFKEEPMPENIAIGDSLVAKIKYYAAVAAVMIPDRDAAIEMFEEIKGLNFGEEKRVYIQLASLYHQKEDTVKYVDILKEGVALYPEETYFVQNLINVTYSQGRFDEAEAFLLKAIEISPDNPQFYDILGLIYENDKRIDAAIESVKKAVEIDPNFMAGLSHLGRLYYNLGAEKRSNIDVLADREKYEEEIAIVNDYFKQAIPYFIKAYELNPEDHDAVFALRNIYYSLGMNKEYEEMDKIYEGIGEE